MRWERGGWGYDWDEGDDELHGLGVPWGRTEGSSHYHLGL